MANPQLKNGYTRIANELLEAICQLNISGCEMRILLYIIRKTYGFGVNYAEISRSEIAKSVGIPNERVSKVLKKLKEYNIIDHRPSKGVTPQTISVNKNYDKWLGFDNVKSVKIDTGVKKNTGVEIDTPTGVEIDTPTGVEIDTPTGVEIDTPTYKESNKEITKESKERQQPQKSYGDNGRVILSEEEYEQLIDDYDDDVIKDYIKRLDKWIASKNAKVSDCNETLRSWLRKDDVPKRDKSVDKYKQFINRF